jgi:predicted phosphodiesterase
MLDRARELVAAGFGRYRIMRELGIGEKAARNLVRSIKLEQDDAIEVVVGNNIELGKSRQRLLDVNRKTRQQLRESYRRVNVLEELDAKLIEALKTHKFGCRRMVVNEPQVEGGCVAVLQISDAHFNELINTPSNRYDFDIASKRLAAYADKALHHLSAYRVQRVIIALTGDLLNSDRRLDEILAAATNRTHAMLLATDLLASFISYIAEVYPVTVASVCGNESRCKDEVAHTRVGASDNYDAAIFSFLRLLLEDHDIAFASGDNPLEVLLDINDFHLLLTHGTALAGGDVERAVSQLIGRYAQAGKRVDYVLCGHIHASRIGDTFARSGSLCGSNAYNENKLNLQGRASQNMFILDGSGAIHGTRIDLQLLNYPWQFEFDKRLEAYNCKSEDRARESTCVFKVVI